MLSSEREREEHVQCRSMRLYHAPRPPFSSESWLPLLFVYIGSLDIFAKYPRSFTTGMVDIREFTSAWESYAAWECPKASHNLQKKQQLVPLYQCRGSKDPSNDRQIFPNRSCPPGLYCEETGIDTSTDVFGSWYT